MLRLHARSRGETKLDRIAAVPLFRGLTTDELEAVAHEADEITVPAGHRLIRQGAIGHEFVVVLDGEAIVERNGEQICRLASGDYAGEVALLTDRRRSATITTTTPARVLVISDYAFRRLVAEVPGLATKLLPGFAQHLAA